MNSKKAIVSAATVVAVASAAFFFWNYSRRVSNDRVYRVGWESNPPYQQSGADGGPTGLAIDLVREAARRRSIRLDWVYQPGGSENALLNKLVDLWPLMTITPARKGLVYFSDPYLQHHHGLLVWADSPYQRHQDLAHARVARSRVLLDEQMVRQILPDSILVVKPSQKQAIEDLCEGRADAAFVEEFTGVSFALNGMSCSVHRLRLIWIEELESKLAVSSTFAAQAVADELRKGIGEIAQDGGLPQMLARWGYYSPQNVKSIVELLDAQRRERQLIGAIALLTLLLALAVFGADRIRRQKNRINSLLAVIARRDSDDQFREMADSAPAMVWVSDPDGGCTFFNKDWLTFTGRAMEEEIGFGWVASVHPDDLDRCLSVYTSAVKERHDFRLDYRLRRADGIYRSILDHGVPHFEKGNVFAGFVGCCVDITDLKSAQEEDLARQKMESVGRLAGGIAHDFNNLLGAVLANAELAMEELSSGLEPVEELENVRRVAIRGSEIVRQLMIYAGQERGEVELVDVSSTVAEVLELLKLSMSKRAIFKTDLGMDLGAVRAHPAQLRQIVMNVVSNASDAIGEHEGVITLITRRKTVAAGSRWSNTGALPEGEYVQMCVSDTGVGIPPEAQARVFDPFFTTKVGHGHGLGLAVVAGIVRELGGAVSIQSARGQGTTFEILLPGTSEHTDRREILDTTPLEAEAQDAKGAILVVEDESGFRAAVSRFLRMRGFSVMEAVDGTEAVETLQSHCAQIALVLLDVTLPGKSSHEVFEAARRLKPGIKVIVTSAYGESHVAGFFPGAQVEHFIRKPYRLAELVELVSTVLSE